MTVEIFEAILKAALPLGALSFFLFRWNYKSGRLTGASGRKALKAEMRALKKNKKIKTRNPIHNKWVKFGGGFYGLVGLWTFLVIEVLEIYDMAKGYEGMDGVMASLSNSSFVDLGIRFLINSALNFGAAIGWPAYWVNILKSQNIWIWLVAAYAGYWIGMKMARLQLRDKQASVIE